MKKIKRIIFVLFLLFLVYIFHPFWLTEMAKVLIVQDQLQKVDAILVLAGDNNGERTAQGVELYKKGYAKHLILSGGALGWKLTSAQNMKDQAVFFGIPSNAILLEEKSESTRENVLFTLDIVKKNNFKSIILVTSPTHTRRSKHVFRKVYDKEGIKVLVYPVQNSKWKLNRWWTRHEDTQPVIQEYVSLLGYLIKGW